MATAVSNEKLIEAMVRAGGSRWQKGAMDRIYFNDLPTWYGLKCSYYNTGNISGASLDDEGISNGKARQIIERLQGKLWYDVATGQWSYRAEFGPVTYHDLFVAALAEVKLAIAQQMVA